MKYPRKRLGLTELFPNLFFHWDQRVWEWKFFFALCYGLPQPGDNFRLSIGLHFRYPIFSNFKCFTGLVISKGLWIRRIGLESEDAKKLVYSSKTELEKAHKKLLDNSSKLC